jgi:hypothetical protein
MSMTTIRLMGYSPSKYQQKPKPVAIEASHANTPKGKYDVLNLGKVSHVTVAGAQIRVFQRGQICCKNGDPYNTDLGNQCWWHRRIIKGKSMGYPVRVEHNAGHLKVYMDGFFCSYSCTLAFIEEELKKKEWKRDFDAVESKTILLNLFKDEFPDEDLVPANDWKVQSHVGNGSLSEKDYFSALVGVRLHAHPALSFSQVTVSYDITSQKQ